MDLEVKQQNPLRQQQATLSSLLPLEWRERTQSDKEWMPSIETERL